jgi:hypothetical protein
MVHTIGGYEARRFPRYCVGTDPAAARGRYTKEGQVLSCDHAQSLLIVAARFPSATGKFGQGSSGCRAGRMHLLRQLGEYGLEGVLALVRGDLDGQLLDRVGLVLDVDINSHAGGRHGLSPGGSGGPQSNPVPNKGATDNTPACGDERGRAVSGALRREEKTAFGGRAGSRSCMRQLLPYPSARQAALARQADLQVANDDAGW